MFLLVPAHPCCPGQIPQSRKTVVCVFLKQINANDDNDNGNDDDDDATFSSRLSDHLLFV